MRTFGAFLLAATLGAGMGVQGVAQAKGKKKGDEAAPRASSSEVQKLKAVRFGDPKAGFFKWGMHPDEVQKLASVQVEVTPAFAAPAAVNNPRAARILTFRIGFPLLW